MPWKYSGISHLICRRRHIFGGRAGWVGGGWGGLRRAGWALNWTTSHDPHCVLTLTGPLNTLLTLNNCLVFVVNLTLRYNHPPSVYCVHNCTGKSTITHLTFTKLVRSSTPNLAGTACSRYLGAKYCHLLCTRIL